MTTKTKRIGALGARRQDTRLPLAIKMLSAAFAVCEEAYRATRPECWSQEYLAQDRANTLIPAALKRFVLEGHVTKVEQLLGRRSCAFASTAYQEGRNWFWQEPDASRLPPPGRPRKKP